MSKALGQPDKYLVFRVAGCVMGLDARCVHEILPRKSVNISVPGDSSGCGRGTFRGQPCPVVDLLKVLEMDGDWPGHRNASVVMLHLPPDGARSPVGLLVGEVLWVMDAAAGRPCTDGVVEGIIGTRFISLVMDFGDRMRVAMLNERALYRHVLRAPSDRAQRGVPRPPAARHGP